MSDNAKKQATIKVRQRQEQESLLKELHKKPNVEYACAKVGISRSTYYRWLKESRKFAQAAQQALKESRERVNDWAEAVIIGKVTEKDVGASKYWLAHNHPHYMSRRKRKKREEEQSIKTLIMDI